MNIKGNELWDIPLVQDFQNKNTNTINQCSDKNSLGCVITVCIYIKSKQNSIGQQAEGANGSDEFIFMKEKIKEL